MLSLQNDKRFLQLLCQTDGHLTSARKLFADGPVAQGSKLVCAWLREAQFCCYLDILHGHGILLSMNIVLPTILCTLYAAVLFRLVVERSHERRSRNGRFLRRHITALGYRNRSCAEDHFRQKKTQALSDQRENAQFLPKENSKNTRFVCELMQK